MGLRFIHKNGHVIPVHSDHGDQQAPGPQHASPVTPPSTQPPAAPAAAAPAAPKAKAHSVKVFGYKASVKKC